MCLRKKWNPWKSTVSIEAVKVYLNKQNEKVQGNGTTDFG